MINEFKRGINPKKSLMIGRDIFKEALQEILDAKPSSDPCQHEKMIHMIGIKKNRSIPSLIFYYEYAAGVLAKDKFPEILKGIMEQIPYYSEVPYYSEAPYYSEDGDDPYTKIRRALYFYRLDPTYYDLFKDILKEINEN